MTNVGRENERKEEIEKGNDNVSRGLIRKNPQALIGGFSKNLNLKFSLGR